MDSSTEPLSPIRKNTVVNQVMDRLKELISSGVYKPGDKLPTEKELAAQLHVGRSSIRETIKTFNHLGVLESKSAVGTFVRSRSSISREALTWAFLLGEDDIEMVLDLRAAIELWSYLQLTMRFRESPDSIAPILSNLKTILEAMRRGIDSGEAPAVIQADYDFHYCVIASVSNTLFVDFYDMLRSFLLKEIEKSQNMYTVRSQILAEHTELLNALVSGNPETAESAFLSHIANIKNLLGIKTL
ncbi:MAG: FadR/GntR family transcriptional regulator [Spirochaetes bacterium]|nr:FadR/GntR family transcriptional regulator [Spirochaetota bacterium]